MTLTWDKPTEEIAYVWLWWVQGQENLWILGFKPFKRRFKVQKRWFLIKFLMLLTKKKKVQKRKYFIYGQKEKEKKHNRTFSKISVNSEQ